mgnify:CR=1 FL=1
MRKSTQSVKRIPIFRPLITIVGHKPKSVLEVGCADGYRLNFFRERYDSKAAGIEISAAAIEGGKAKYPEIDLSVGSASDLSQYEAGSFDCARSATEPGFNSSDIPV